VNRFKFWHRLRGHKVERVAFDPDTVLQRLTSTGHNGDQHSRAMLLAAMHVVTMCSCGDHWVFTSMGGYETYFRAAQQIPGA